MKRVLAFLILSTLFLSACNMQEPDGAVTPESAEAARLTADDLQNATYTLAEIYEAPITLEDGYYADEDGIFTVSYRENSTQFGDLDGDGVDDAIVFLEERGGGTATNLFAAAQRNEGGQAVDAGSVLVDSNIQIISATIEDGQLRLEVTARGPGDANCCASHRTERAFALQDGVLAELGEPAEAVRVSADDLNGTSWTLVELAAEQPALGDPPITITFEDGNVVGSSGCNNYLASFALDDVNPFMIHIGPSITTRMSCSEPIMNQEATYLAALENASLWGYDMGKLAIARVEDEGLPERLLFTPADATEANSSETEEEPTAAPTDDSQAEPTPETEAEVPAGTEADAVDVTTLCDAGNDFAECDGGPRVVVGEVSSGNFAFMPALFPNPSVLLFDMTNIIGRQPEVFVPESGQILGIFTDDLFPQPGEFSISLPIEPTGAYLDVDNDGAVEQGVQIYALMVGSNLFGSSHLQQMEQESGLVSYLTDFVTGQITEGIFLLYAPDDSQDFPAEPGADGVWFSGDEATITLPAGYSLATLPAEGTITLDRSPQLAMTNLERSEFESPDFSDQGILESFNSLIDLLSERYAYTDLRDLDWEAIRAGYLPRVEQADSEQDMAAYYDLLRELAVSLNDSHVSASTFNPVLVQATSGSDQNNATVGASVFAAWDEMEELPGERILVLSVGEESPAAEAGWVPGTEILSIDGEPIAERVGAVQLSLGIGTETVRLATQASQVLRFAEGQEVTIEYRLPDSEEVLSATMVAGAYDIGQAFPPSAASTPVSFERLGEYGVVRWGDFVHYLLPKLAILEEALSVEQNQTSGGVILDLRGNGGGWTILQKTMASYFFTAEDPMPDRVYDSYYYIESLGERVLRYEPAYMVSAPMPEFAYTGPVVVLVDNLCASACEYFSQLLQELDRATIIGQYPTSGAGGTIDRATMPAGITFQFTQGTTYFAGTQEPNLEAKGVVPDIRVPVTLETELAKIQGEDPLLDAAVAFLDETSDRFTGTTWRWTATGDATTGTETPIVHDGVYEVTFNTDGTVAITADCNQAMGTYTRTEFDQLTISVDTTTLALCPGDSLSESFLQDLGNVTFFAFDVDRLLLFEQSADGEPSALLFEEVQDAAPSGAGAMDEAASLTEEALRNATYTLTEMFEAPITLQDGSYADEDSIITVDYMADSAQFGDLDGDGVDDAIVFLQERGGGTATNLYAAAQRNEGGQAVDAGSLLVDSNIQIISAAIEDGQLRLAVTTRGPGDANCCASHRTERTFALLDGLLAEVGEPMEPVRVSATDLDGTSWTLTELAAGQPALQEPPLTITFEEGSLAGSGGCNNYSASFTLSEDNPFIITIGPIITTRMSCPEPIMNQEATYLAALENASLWGYDMGKLAIARVEDGELPERLLFTPADAIVADRAETDMAASAGEAAADDSVSPDFQLLDECFVNIPETIDHDCGYITVPEFHDGRTDGTLSLGVVRLRSTADEPAAPLFFGAGGPGGSVMSWAGATADEIVFDASTAYGEILADRDLVYFTQRGTQYAQPFLNCPEEREAENELAQALTYDEHLRLEIDVLRRCHDRLIEAGVNLDAYNSLENSADINTIRHALGYDQIVYYGESYGTILGQHLMRDFPEILESVILDGTASLSITSWEQDTARKYQVVLERLVALCDASEPCSAAYPDFAENLDAVFAQAESDPLQVLLTTSDGTEIAVPVDRSVLASTLYTNLYATSSIAKFPLAVQEMLAGETATFQDFYSLANSAFSDMATMMHASVVCSEDPVAGDDDLNAPEGAFAIAVEHAREGVTSYSAICELISVAPIEETDENVASDLPVLVLSGALDPATPNFRSEEVADALPNSVSFLFPHGSHVQIRPMSNCAVEIMAQFIADPSTEPDGSCIDLLPATAFFLPVPTPDDIKGVQLSLFRTFIDGEVMDVDESANFNLTFSDVGVEIQADCSNVSGTYTVDENSNILIDLGSATLVECGPDSVADTVLATLDSADITILSKTLEGKINLAFISKATGDTVIFSD